MFLKTDWITHLHKTRAHEIKLLFDFLGGKHIESGLEIGAGDGYQTSLLSQKIHNLVSTDLNFNRIKIKTDKVTYIQADADNLSEVFVGKDFDLIFSSSVLEHLTNLDSFLLNSHDLLNTDGYAVHFVPTRFMKIVYLIMFYPNVTLLIIDRLIGLFKGKEIFRGYKGDSDNNVNVVKEKTSRWVRLLLPSIHGAYKSHYEEFVMWGDSRWRDVFKKNNYQIVGVIQGGVHSGYGFGIDFIRPVLSFFGICSVNGYVLRKK